MEDLLNNVDLELEKIYEILKENEDEELKRVITDKISVSLCKVLKILVPNVHQKIDEIVYASENDLKVSEKQFGADMHDKNGSNIELKTSICTTKTNICNFNWHVPKGETENERRQNLLNSIREKVGNGGHANLIIKDGNGKDLRRFKLEQRFLLEYFNKIPLGECDVHNMGCKRCSKCQKFHRLEKLQEYNDKLEKVEKLTDSDWKVILANSVSCKKVIK